MANQAGDDKGGPGLERIDREIFSIETAYLLFQNSPDGILLVDSDGLIRMVNQQAEWLSGYHHSELYGQPVEMLVPAALQEVHMTHRHDYLSEPRVRPMGPDMHLRLVRKNETEIPVEISLGPVVTPRGLFTAAIIRRVRSRPASKPGP